MDRTASGFSPRAMAWIDPVARFGLFARGLLFLGVGGFVLYAALCAVSLGFVQRCVPETKGKTLEEIEAMLSG